MCSCEESSAWERCNSVKYLGYLDLLLFGLIKLGDRKHNMIPFAFGFFVMAGEEAIEATLWESQKFAEGLPRNCLVCKSENVQDPLKSTESGLIECTNLERITYSFEHQLRILEGSSVFWLCRYRLLTASKIRQTKRSPTSRAIPSGLQPPFPLAGAWVKDFLLGFVEERSIMWKERIQLVLTANKGTGWNRRAGGWLKPSPGFDQQRWG